MTFETMGDRSNSAVLLIHGMLCTAKDCMGFGKYLADDYYVIMPTLDGHGNDGTDLLSAEGEASKILDYLRENGIDRLALIQGSSMGAEVALALYELLNTKGIPVHRCFFDGGPFFDLTPAYRKFMYAKFRNLVKIFDTDDHEEAYSKVMDSGMMKFVAKEKATEFEPIIRSITAERRSFSDSTIRNMVKICYNCKLPHFTEGEQRRMIFFHSKEEPAVKCRKRLVKAYPVAVYRGISGYAHCGLQIKKPKGYAELLKKAIQEEL